MKAIIVPGVTDMNKGDQALVWESYRLIKDTKLFDEISVLSSGDTAEEFESLCSQTIKRGIPIITNILKHPRRGRHPESEVTKEGFFYKLYQLSNALSDFFSRNILLLVCNNKFLLNLVFARETVETVEEFSASNVIFVKGGGFIHAYGESRAPYVIWFFLFYIRLAKKLGKKVIFLPNSYGPFKGFSVAWQVKNVFGSLERVYAREPVSAESINRLIHEPVSIYPDLGFFLEAEEASFGREVLSRYGVGDSDSVVGITVRPWRFPESMDPEKSYKDYLDGVYELVLHVMEKGYKVAFFNQSIGPNKHEDDREAIKTFFHEKIDFDESIFWVDENFTCSELKSIYSNLYAFVGTRFHSVIFSMTSYVPSIAIGYGGNKAAGIMKDLDLSHYTVPIDEVDSGGLINMFSTLETERELVMDKIGHGLVVINQKRKEMLADIISVCES